MKLSMLPWPIGLLKLMLIFFAQVMFKGEKSTDVILWNIYI